MFDASFFFLIRGFLNARVFIIIISLFCLKMNEKKYMDLGGKNSSEMLKLRKAISICMRDAVTLCCLIFFRCSFFSSSQSMICSAFVSLVHRVHLGSGGGGGGVGGRTASNSIIIYAQQNKTTLNDHAK